MGEEDLVAHHSDVVRVKFEIKNFMSSRCWVLSSRKGCRLMGVYGEVLGKFYSFSCSG